MICYILLCFPMLFHPGDPVNTVLDNCHTVGSERWDNCQTAVQKTDRKQFKGLFGDDSVSLRRIWTKLGGNSHHKPRGASYTAQGPQGQPEICGNTFFGETNMKICIFRLGFRFPDLWRLGAGSREEISRRIRIWGPIFYVWAPASKDDEKRKL